MKRVGRRADAWLGLAALVLFLVIWELLPALGLVRPVFSSSPSRIVRAAFSLAQNGLWHHIAVSGGEFLLGFTLAAVVGIALGLAMGWYRRLDAVFDPFIQLFNATPRLALAPLMIIWLGIGLVSKVAIVFLGGIVSIVLNTRSGLRDVPQPLVQCARVFGATDRQLFLTVALPTALPWIIAGLRLAVGRALIAVVIAELLSSTAGLGHLITISTTSLQTDKVFVAVAILAGTGLALSKLLGALETRFENWRPRH
jgi:NitT/TauT family transport system permease protein